jgi:hypothetical protein
VKFEGSKPEVRVLESSSAWQMAGPLPHLTCPTPVIRLVPIAAMRLSIQLKLPFLRVCLCSSKVLLTCVIDFFTLTLLIPSILFPTHSLLFRSLPRPWVFL